MYSKRSTNIQENACRLTVVVIKWRLGPVWVTINLAHFVCMTYYECKRNILMDFPKDSEVTKAENTRSEKQTVTY